MSTPVSEWPAKAKHAVIEWFGLLRMARARVGSSADAEVAELMSSNPVARRHRYPVGHRMLRGLFNRGTFGRFVLIYVLLDVAVVAIEACRPLLPATPFAIPSLSRDVILYLSSYVLGAQVGLLGVISLALALVTLVAQGEDATTDVKVYYHESMFLGIAASGVALAAVVSAQFLWPVQTILHLVGGGTPSLVYRSALVSVEVVWLVINLVAVAHFVAVTFAFVQRDARERLRQRYTANVVFPRGLRERVRQHFYAAAGGAGDGGGPKAFLGSGNGIGGHVELEDEFPPRSAVVNLRTGLVKWVVARWSARCAAEQPGPGTMGGAPTLWFLPRLDQRMEGRKVWCRRTGGVPLTGVERWMLRRAFVVRRVRDD